MRLTPLNDRLVKSMKAPEKLKQISDAGCPNLFLRVYPSGKKTWMWRGRVEGKPVAKVGDPFPERGVAEAREWAIELNRERMKGFVPKSVREARVAAKVAAEGEASRTVDAVWKAYFAAEGRLGKDAANKQKKYDREVKLTLGTRQIGSLTYEDLAGLVDAKSVDFPGAANQLHALLSRFMRWSVTKGRAQSGLTSNVYRDAELPNRTNKRDRVLSDSEVKLLWKVLDAETVTWRCFYRVGLLTGIRRAGVAGMRKAELELDGVEQMWTIPKERTKSGLAHVVPLPPLVVTVIKEAITANEKSEFVFPAATTQNTAISGFSKIQKRVVAAMVREKKMAIERWTIHDFRRTVATGMARLGVPDIVIESTIEHASGRKAGVAGIYNRYAYVNERRDALVKWAERVTEIVK